MPVYASLCASKHRRVRVRGKGGSFGITHTHSSVSQTSGSAVGCNMSRSTKAHEDLDNKINASAACSPFICNFISILRILDL